MCVCALIYHNLSPSTEETPRFSRTALLLAVHGLTCIHTCVCVCGCEGGGVKGACIHACGHAYTLIHTCAHIYMCVCVCMCLCVCVCVRVHLFIIIYHLQQRRLQDSSEGPSCWQCLARQQGAHSALHYFTASSHRDCP